MTDKTKQSPDLRTRSGLGQKPWHSAGEKEKPLLSEHPFCAQCWAE